jgi:hypothetical protein
MGQVPMEVYLVVKSLRAENATLRNAQKACDDCDAPTMEETKRLRAENAQLRQMLLGTRDYAEWNVADLQGALAKHQPST